MANQSASELLYEKASEVSKELGFLSPYDEMKQIALSLAEEVIALRAKVTA